jgi:hypothetical protein
LCFAFDIFDNIRKYRIHNRKALGVYHVMIPQ